MEAGGVKDWCAPSIASSFVPNGYSKKEEANKGRSIAHQILIMHCVFEPPKNFASKAAQALVPVGTVHRVPIIPRARGASHIPTGSLVGCSHRVITGSTSLPPTASCQSWLLLSSPSRPEKPENVFVVRSEKPEKWEGSLFQQSKQNNRFHTSHTLLSSTRRTRQRK